MAIQYLKKGKIHMSGYLIAQLNVKNLELYKKYPEYIYDLSSRTLVRDLDKAGNKISQGKWEITKNLN